MRALVLALVVGVIVGCGGSGASSDAGPADVGGADAPAADSRPVDGSGRENAEDELRDQEGAADAPTDKAGDAGPDAAVGDAPETENVDAEVELVPDANADADADTVDLADSAPEIFEDHSTLTPALVEAICKDLYCSHYEGCFGSKPEGGCVADCMAKVGADEKFAKKLFCSRGAAYTNWCAGFEECADDWEIADKCKSNCSLAENCDAMGNNFLGYDKFDCLFTCSGFYSAGPQAQQILMCTGKALATCSGAEFEACTKQPQNPCSFNVCDIGRASACGLIPEFFADTTECKEACSDWNAGQLTAWTACHALAADWALPCGSSTFNCMAAPSVLPEGAVEYCHEFLGKCKASGALYLGALTDELCAWQVLGQALSGPDVFGGWAGAQECLKQWVKCPPPVLGFPSAEIPREMLCLATPTPDVAQICQIMGDLCEQEADSPIHGTNCLAALLHLQVSDPDAASSATTCLFDAGTCNEMLACFDL